MNKPLNSEGLKIKKSPDHTLTRQFEKPFTPKISIGSILMSFFVEDGEER
jgi:hypothetical protein